MKNPLLTGLYALFGVLLWVPTNAADLSGTYTIDKSGSGTRNFTSFAAAADAVNISKITGPVIFKVADGIYQEQVRLEPYYGATATNTIRFESASGDATKVTLTWPSSNSSLDYNFTLGLHSANYITFDRMTIQRTGSATYTSTLQLDDNKGAKFTNNILLGPKNLPASNTPNAVVYSKVDVNTNLLIENNLIRGGQHGVSLWNTETIEYGEGLMISGNTIDSFTSSGVTVARGYDATISGNTITLLNGGFGIYMRDYFGTETRIVSNRIISLSTQLSIGIDIYLISGFPNMAAATVANNFISIAGGNSSSGIVTLMPTDLEYNGGYIAIYHNSINLTADDNTSKGIWVTKADYDDVYDIRNNSIVCNTGYPLYLADGVQPEAFTNLDYNNYYTGGDYLVQAGGTNFETLEDWQTTGFDVSSISIDPDYTSATDLHASTAALDNAGANVAITEDIDGDARDTKTPDIGADEFVAQIPDAGIFRIDSLMPSYCDEITREVAVRLKNYGNTRVKMAKISWTLNGNPMGTITWKGTLKPGDDTSIVLDAVLFARPSTSAIVAYVESVNGATDTDASNDSAKFTVTVSDPDAGFAYGERAGKALAFRSDDKVSTTVSWNFGDGNTSTDKEPIHTYSATGKYKVTHTTTTTTACQAVFSDSVTVTGTAGINGNTNELAGSISTYPNPFTNDITVSYSLEKSASITLQLLDVSGRLVSEYKLPQQAAGNHSFNVDGTALRAGVYLLKLDTGKATAYSRIMKK